MDGISREEIRLKFEVLREVIIAEQAVLEKMPEESLLNGTSLNKAQIGELLSVGNIQITRINELKKRLNLLLEQYNTFKK